LFICIYQLKQNNEHNGSLFENVSVYLISTFTLSIVVLNRIIQMTNRSENDLEMFGDDINLEKKI